MTSRFCRGDRCIESDLVQEAVWNFWDLDEIILCISDPNLAPVAAECEERGIAIRKLWIPDGSTEDDLWETFTLLGEVAEDGEEILFDITGGCHALPFVISLAATYLREIRRVRVSGVIYAPPPDEYGLRHFVDLKSLMSVSDWITGVKAVTSYTDATPVRRLLTGLQSGIHREHEEPDPPTHLIGWSHLLGSFTSAVRLARPIDALYAGFGINHDLPAVKEEVTRFAPSLVPMMGDMHIICRMAAPPPGTGLTPEYLMLQYRLITYQIDKGLDFQAASLSREWLISATMLVFEVGHQWLDARCRHLVSRTLTGMALTMQGKPAESTVFSLKLGKKQNNKEMVRIWERVSDLRNDLAHCGMNERDESLKSILKRTALLPDDLMIFAGYAGLQ